MVSRFHLLCPGCSEKFIARIGVEPTTGTRFYLPCPGCRLPIKGSISGTEFVDRRVTFECEVINDADLDLPGALTVTINPFVPSRYDADSYSPIGAFPTMTLLQMLGQDRFHSFESERHVAIDLIVRIWPDTRMLFQYFLQGNWNMFNRIAKEKFGADWEPKTAHERTSVAYQTLAFATTGVVGSTGNHSEAIMNRFSRKHTAAIKHKPHLMLFRERGALAAHLERDVFTEIARFIAHHDSWEMGRLVRFLPPEPEANIEGLVLYRDEFSVVRDLYQQGFELACKCIWPLVAAQNTVKRGDPNDFGNVHPEHDKVPVNKRPKNLKQFDKLPNVYKIAYAAQVPGWDSLATLLDNRQRNTIGHATAHHDLQIGRVVSDENPDGIAYLDFLGLTFGVFEALAVLAQVLRSARVASSPDFL